MADMERSPGPSNPDESREVIGEPNQPINLDYGDYPNEEEASESSDSEAEPCFQLRLKPRDVDLRINQLYLHAEAASTLLANPDDILQNPNPRSFCRRLTMHDDAYEYDMFLSYSPNGGFMITRDWKFFIKRNQLQAEDLVAFEKSRASDNTNGQDYDYYISCLKTPRIGLNKEDTRLSSRYVSNDKPCLLVVLTSPKSSEPISMLHLSPKDANLLMGEDTVSDNPLGPFSVDLLMLDSEDRSYNMNLSCKVGYGGPNALFTLNTGRYVSANNLREGDTVEFYKYSKDGNRYYVLKCFKVPPMIKTDEITPARSRCTEPSPEHDKLCLSITLNDRAVDFNEPALHLDAYEAFRLTGCKELLEPPSNTYQMNLVAYDDLGAQYKLLLSYATSGNWVGYSMTQDWGEYISINYLEAGDLVEFYTLVVEGSTNYFLKHVKKPSDGVKVQREKRPPRDLGKQDGSNELKKKAGPGSRVIPDEQPTCFWKFLSAAEVGSDGGSPKLFIDAVAAGYIITCLDIQGAYPLGMLRENLIVFDVDDKKYDVLLTHTRWGGNYGMLVYYLDAGWQRLVELHNLRAGDAVWMYRLTDLNVHDQPYFVIRYRRKGIVIGDTSAAEPSGRKE